MWMDHRASEEAAAINRTKHPLLQFVGGKISNEMEMPKVLWIKKVLDEAIYNGVFLLVIINTEIKCFYFWNIIMNFAISELERNMG